MKVTVLSAENAITIIPHATVPAVNAKTARTTGAQPAVSVLKMLLMKDCTAEIAEPAMKNSPHAKAVAEPAKTVRQTFATSAICA